MMDDTDAVYTHLDATSSIVPHLKAHLPHASTELYVVEVPPTPNSTVLATFPPTESPPESSAWAVGVLGITGVLEEAEFYFWSSVEAAPTINRDDDEEHFRTAYAHFEQMLKFIGRKYPEKETLMIGSLHSTIASYIPMSSRCRLSTWTKFAFSKDLLPPPSSYSQDLESKYIFRRMEMDELDEVLQTSSVVRTKASMARAPNTAAYLRSEESRAQAWCFISREGDISSVYVKPEARGMGLGKELVRKELEKEFANRDFVVAHVSSANTASLRMCQSLGARSVFDIAWGTILIKQYRDN